MVASMLVSSPDRGIRYSAIRLNRFSRKVVLLFRFSMVPSIVLSRLMLSTKSWDDFGSKSICDLFF
jgi:hypothetical protein